MWKIFWEYPLTAYVTIFITFFYFFVVFFVSSSSINQYFLSYPGRFHPLNWILSTFFHGSIEHLLSNMVFLYFLGRVAEARVGKVKWLLFYFMAGFISAASDSVVRGYVFREDMAPAVGASGAISGIAAVAALLSPFTFRVKNYNIPFPVFAVAWTMLYSDFIYLFSSDRVAHWAHLAGFFSVFITAYLLNDRDREELKNGFLLNFVFFILTVILLFFLNNR
ncbi:MAG: rhomboid family intramembrane serine protease [Leptospiraceae bacterium]|nr:rhomboid family intramembrane serine protease [Leptospiraceae bacterium]